MFFFGTAATLVVGSACTLLAPGESQDGVERCGAAIDCADKGDDPDDNRISYDCVYGDGQSEDSPGVCEPTYRLVGCGFKSSDANEYPDLAGKLGKIEENLDPYLADCTPGALGCKPDADSGCSDGLESVTLTAAGGTAIEVCSQAGQPASIAYSVLAEAYGTTDPVKNLPGIDLRNQFCAWYFCDTNFVCDASKADKGQWRCTYCDPEKTPDQGGCATVTVDDKQSPVYLGVDECNKGSTDISKAVAGEPPG
jgi:hypothetical protein